MKFRCKSFVNKGRMLDSLTVFPRKRWKCGIPCGVAPGVSETYADMSHAFAVQSGWVFTFGRLKGIPGFVHFISLHNTTSRRRARFSSEYTVELPNSSPFWVLLRADIHAVKHLERDVMFSIVLLTSCEQEKFFEYQGFLLPLFPNRVTPKCCWKTFIKGNYRC